MEKFVGCITILLILAVLYLLTGFIGMLLWNGVLVELFTSVPKISFLQMYGLIWLAHIIFPSTSIPRSR